MKNNTLYILSGIQGSGKSTFIEKNELQGITMSYDKLRELYAGVEMTEKGHFALSGAQNERVFAMGNELLRERMRGTGGNLVIDNMNVDVDSLIGFKAIADEHFYKTVVVRFPLLVLEHYYNINKQRPEYKKIDEFIIKKWHDIASNFNPSQVKGVEIITPAQFENIINRKPDVYLKDISDYEKIHVFGDLQGCFTVLNKYFNTEGMLSNKHFYIFVGDYLDRGIENGLALKFVEKFIDKENFLFLYGNHEKNLMNHASGWYQPSKEFLEKTLPQLLKSGFDKEKMMSIFNKMDGVNYLKFHDKKLIISHAGFPSIPNLPFFITREAEMYGYGNYGFDVDKSFAENKNHSNWIQVHGHRNQHGLTFKTYKNSFALENGVEFGGSLPVLNFELEKGIVIVKGFNIGNEVFDPNIKPHGAKDMIFTTRVTDSKVAGYDATIDQNINNVEIIQLLRNHELIKEKSFESKPHISSFNFTRDAFYDSKNSFRDELVSQARGIFINTENGDIVARGFEKFFNINERGIEQSSMEHVKEHFATPIQLFLKENGYLGLIGYDKKSDELVYTSKSDIELEFAKNLEGIIQNQFSEEEIVKLKNFARMHNINYILEVNDPVNDPHIVEYEKAHVVLLAVVKREFLYQELSYNATKEFAESFDNFPVKQKGPRFPTFEAFEKFYNSVTTTDGLNHKMQIEGFVVEDANLNRVKIKLPFYNLWKVNRSIKDYLVRQIVKIDEKVEKNASVSKEALVNELMSQTYQKISSHGLLTEGDKVTTKAFVDWFIKQSEADKEKDIIHLRKAFIESQNKNEYTKKEENRNKIKPA